MIQKGAEPLTLDFCCWRCERGLTCEKQQKPQMVQRRDREPVTIQALKSDFIHRLKGER